MSMMDYNHEQAQRNWNNNVIRQPMLPDTIRFNHTIGNDQTEVMRITRDGVWVNPNVSVDDAAKAVLTALDSHIKTLVEAAVQAERRPWVGLTKEERQEIWRNLGHGGPGEFADALEAKLKEKNQ